MNNDALAVKKKIEEEGLRLDKKSSRIAMVRLFVFILAIILLYMGFKGKNVVEILISALLFVLFVFLVRTHGKVDESILDIKAKSVVLNRYVKRESGEWKSFKDDGSDFLKPNDTLSYDLDLLGRGSLFQMISIAHTVVGRQRLADVLSLKHFDITKIKERFEATKELSNKWEFLVDFESSAERILQKREKEEERLSLMDEDDTKNKKKDVSFFPVWMYPLMILVPALNIFAIVLVLAEGANPSMILVSFIAGLIITWGPMAITSSITEPLSMYGSGASDYYKMLSFISEMSFESKLLKDIHDRTTSKDGLLQAIKSMSVISACNNIAFNPLVHIILSGFLGWDFFITFAVSKWRKKNDGVFDECIDIISEIEELGSLAVLSMVRDTSEPEIIEGKPKLYMKSVYHPLISKASVISNDAELSESLTIITGSNMSGKTTYMRTVAINMVLAYIGAGVCAEEFKVPYMKIFTSMRVMDDVAGGISTFYAEILRIKEMAEYVDRNEDIPALCLIDEIFKGTNSADRIVGAREALQKLSAGNAMVIVTTHDFELCDLTTKDGKQADNYHFEEYYENNELKFDYKIRDGRCTTRNAIAILKMAGLVEE